jgi:Fe-S-cluster containining protein
MARMQYGFARTSCSCRRCTISCEHVPGALCPNDIEAMAQHLGYTNVQAFARDCLSIAATGERVTLRTLVPLSQSNGSCTFLSDGKCQIHPVSPYGCAFIDAHQSESDYAIRADALYRAIYNDLVADGIYIRTWKDLQSAGRIATPLSHRQEQLTEAMRREKMI